MAFRSTAAVYSYCRSRGLYAGVSLVGSYIMERKEANRKYVQLSFYSFLTISLVVYIMLCIIRFSEKMLLTCFLQGSMARIFVHLVSSMVMWSHHQRHMTCILFWMTTQTNTQVIFRASI